MKTDMPKQIYFLVLVVLGFVAAHVGSYFAVQKLRPESWKSQRFEASLYVVSPMEEALLEASEELWPRTFHEERLLESRDIPEFYSKAILERHVAGVSLDEVSNARRWSALLNTKHYEPLKEELWGAVQAPSSLDKALYAKPQFKGYERCHLILQERAFRTAQLEPKLRAAVLDYFRGCGAGSSTSLVWLELYPFLLKGDRAQIEALTAKLQKMATDPELKFKRTQASNLLKVIELAMNHVKKD